MITHGLKRALSITALVIAAALTGCGSSTAVAGHNTVDRTSVCAQVSDCHVVATVDVDGDHRTDQVGWRQLGQDAVQIRVRTAGGALLLHRVDVQLWFGGGAWGGAARVDGMPGAELLVGSEQGAHTPMYTMLTYRDEALVIESSPSPLSRRWQVDAAYGDYMGWSRTLVDGHAAMTQTIVYRNDDGKSFTGDSVRYVWKVDRWHRTTRASVSFPTEKGAAAMAGFHVKGLDTFPGLR